MKLKVLFFGSAKILAKESEVDVELSEKATVQDAAQLLLNQYPKLKGISKSLRYALDEEYAASTVRIRDGQTLAVIPPVQGG